MYPRPKGARFYSFPKTPLLDKTDLIELKLVTRRYAYKRHPKKIYGCQVHGCNNQSSSFKEGFYLVKVPRMTTVEYFKKLNYEQ